MGPDQAPADGAKAVQGLICGQEFPDGRRLGDDRQPVEILVGDEIARMKELIVFLKAGAGLGMKGDDGGQEKSRGEPEGLAEESHGLVIFLVVYEKRKRTTYSKGINNYFNIR
jgi:hypothetical protein